MSTSKKTWRGSGGGRAGFTLVELMVVVVIMAALMMFAAPVFQGATRGGALRVASFQFASTLNLARQAAITKRWITHVVIPDSAAILYAAPYQRDADKAFRSYAPYSTRDGYMTDWKFLPPGVVFNPDYDGGVTKNLFTCTANPNFLRQIPFPLATSPQRDMFTMAFRPDGVLHGSAITAVAVYMSEGIVEVDLVAGTAGTPIYKPNVTVLALDTHNITGRVRTREYTPP